ncbi:tRNA epoxyqueuosine(34) reductase QueG [Flavobacterium sp. xlx-214]|uniref:tRNA epoxyqueuosine(34) reductase QueG n=1 Tax=unclassified Flavobacterium TaxID=196869 RepID=UPI0013CF9761|nr:MULTISPECIES: tRNA epoxyqueuosine(34) reductase QueG [unclassified Flavobacterium]MBA5793830.1 tRNA epoxyqueuosine(34) reductase QueG [Flavobacterium sp. xlx-221]QMI84868.1 tRNA epoxyqueuosine(34) reductase QueG [Flavobacterium sp. xlx-214]
MTNKEQYTQFIKQKAQQLGFSYCGVSQATFLEEEAPHLETWLKNNMHGEMQYMENHFDKRLDPRLLVPGAKSVVSLLLNYFPTQQQNADAYKISKYAYGEDYHFVIKDKLKDLLHFIQDEIGEVDGRVFVDSAPVLDKAWAAKAGLGWVGKNNNLIRKQEGSFFFVAELIIDLELMYDTATTNHCGSCTACIDACPTQAIESPYIVNGSKCISYLTIELKDAIPTEFQGKLDDWMYGCDVCQDVCPWNKFSKPHNELLFNPKPTLIDYDKNQWNDLTLEVFNEIFKKSAVKRTKFTGLMRNIQFLNEDK